MTRRRFVRWTAVLLLAVVLMGLGWGWTKVHPKIGQPFELPSGDGGKLWSFGFVGDTHEGRGITNRIFEKLGEAKLEFVMHLGDLVDRGESDPQWEYVMGQAVRNRLRIMPVVGNHDKERSYDDEGEIRFRQYFPHLPRTYYHFRHRGVNFIVLNSEYVPSPGSTQARFLKWQLEQHPGTTVVCIHRPVFTCSERDSANMYLSRLWVHGGLQGSDAVMVLTGHNHYYERTKPLDGITYVVSGGGARNLYPPEPPNEFTEVFKARKNHYGLVDVYADHMHVRILDLADNQIDSFRVPLKPTDLDPGTLGNRSSRELPPLATLPQYQPDRLALRPGFPNQLPRPW